MTEDDTFSALKNRRIVLTDGTIKYQNLAGLTHRDDGPAIIRGEVMSWWKNGKRHRVGGPALITPEADCWWVNGMLHREDGPAIVYKYGRQSEWWINGIPLNTG